MTLAESQRKLAPSNLPRWRDPRPLQLLGSTAPSVILQPPSLQPAQLGHAPIELVVADRVELQADVVERLHRRLVEEQGRDQRRGTDEVAGTDDHVQRVLCLQPRHVAGDVLRATDRRSLRGGDRGVDAEGAGRLEIAVVVVEADDLHAERPARPVVVVVVAVTPTAGMGVGEKRASKQRSDQASANRHGGLLGCGSTSATDAPAAPVLVTGLDDPASV